MKRIQEKSEKVRLKFKHFIQFEMMEHWLLFEKRTHYANAKMKTAAYSNDMKLIGFKATRVTLGL